MVSQARQKVKKNHRRVTRSQNTVFFLVGLVGVLLLSGGMVASYTIYTETAEPYTAELEYATFSLVTGEKGGSVIPASCDSSPAYEHTAGECASPLPKPPTGWLDNAWCADGRIYVAGWTCDPDNFDASLAVHIYRDGSAGGGGTYVNAGTANGYRSDLPPVCGGNPYHAFEFALPQSLSDGVYRNFYAHAIDDGSRGSAGNPVLGGSPKGASCPLVWNTYCTGAGNVNPANDWQWWQYSDSTGVRQYRYLRTGDGACRPAQSAPSSSCFSSQQNINFTWTQAPGSAQNQINLYGVTVPECTAMGWTPYYTPATGAYETCYTSWPATWTTFSLGPVGTYNLGSMSGRTITMALMTRSADSALSDPQWTTASCSATPPPPTNPSGYCSADGRTGTFSWGAPATFNTFYTRVSTDGIGATTGIVDWNDNVVGTSKSFATSPGATYYYWVHTKNPSQAVPNWSTHVGGSFTCPNPVTPQPPGVSCNAAGTAAAITWSSTGANRYYLNFYGLTQASCPSGWTWDGISACYWHNVPSSFGTTINMPLTPGGSHFLRVYPGQPDSLNPGIYQDVGSFTCPLPLAPIDRCPNIAGNQATVPTGQQIDGSGNCVDIPIPPVVDVCPNIAGNQATVPTGQQIDGSGNCVAIPTPPTVDLTATPPLVRSGDPARLTWSVSATYETQCTLTGNGTTVTLPALSTNYPVGTSVNSPNPYLTTAVTNSTTFTLTCVPNQPGITGVAPGSDSVRIDVVPTQQEI